MAAPLRFRTQDTKSAWARKINANFSGISPEMREVPQTQQQWQVELNQLVKRLLAAGYVIPKLFVFRVQDTRQIWARKLNRLLASLAAGTIPVNTVAPAITGTPASGQTLTSTTGTWTGKATITYARQWLRNGAAISGATAATYVLVAGDVGATITCRITATNPNGSAQAVSNGLGPVTA
jgi:hypothetical protein